VRVFFSDYFEHLPPPFFILKTRAQKAAGSEFFSLELFLEITLSGGTGRPGHPHLGSPVQVYGLILDLPTL
jgi:hypothetical protein